MGLSIGAGNVVGVGVIGPRSGEELGDGKGREIGAGDEDNKAGTGGKRKDCGISVNRGKSRSESVTGVVWRLTRDEGESGTRWPACETTRRDDDSVVGSGAVEDGTRVSALAVAVVERKRAGLKRRG